MRRPSRRVTTVLAVALLVVGLPASAAAHVPSVGWGSVPTEPMRVTQRAAVPVLVVLGALARFGLGHVVKVYGRTQVKKAAKSYLIINIPASKWTHIMAPKHKWDTVRARSKEQVAELMSRAMANGRHSAYGTTGRMATWSYRG